MARIWMASFGCLAFACTSPRTAPSTPVVAPAPVDAAPPPIALDSPPAGLRLPASARPIAYQLALDVDPAKLEFSGRVVIEVALSAPAHPLWLDADHLTIDTATFRRDGGAAQPLHVVAGTGDVIGLAADAPIAPGRISVELAYRGETIEGPHGITRHQDRGDRYLVTDLEPQGARRVVPCFDEPGFKVPWQLELTTPAGLFAAANTPIDRDETLPDGRRRVGFAPTGPIASYLLAFVVGPFDAVDAGATRSGAPMRIIVPRGRAADAAFMARAAPTVVAAMEDYTGIPFPFPKLDHVVMPASDSWGMENVGLITYSPEFLLIPDGASAKVRLDALSMMAHEVSHQWFGDLVTAAWWDDLWLNEGFATWASSYVLAEHYRALGGELDAPRSRRFALDAEANPTAHAIRKPIVDAADLAGIFDFITYFKGATVLDTFESSLGPEVFRAGVRAYLGAHRDGNATGADFVAAMSAAAHQDLAAPLAAWLDRPGAPVVAMALACPRGGPATLELVQHRARAAGAVPDDALWPVPVCVRIPDEAAPRCTTLVERTGRIELGDRCPALVVPTGRGHYRTAPSPALRRALVAAWARLGAAEQIALVADTASLVDAGEVELGALLDLLPRAGASDNPIAVETALAALVDLEPVVAPADRAAFQKLVRRAFGKLARRVGWSARPHEPLVAAARMRLLRAVATLGADPVLGHEAIELAGRWLDDPTVIPQATWYSVLSVAVRVGDAALFERMLAQLATTPDVAVRGALAGALSDTSDPTLLARLFTQLAAQPTIPNEELWAFTGPELPATTAVRLGFWRDHGAEVLAKVAEDWRVTLAPSSCLAEMRGELAAVLDATFVPLADYGTASRDRALARLDDCVRIRAATAAPLAAYLAAHR